MSDSKVHTYNTEEYVSPDEILFRHVLTVEEKKIMADIIHAVMNKHNGPGTSVPFVTSQLHLLEGVYNDLEKFFRANPGEYFLRLSTLSPKDAYYQLFLDTPTQEEAEQDTTPVSIDDIKRDLSVLKVSNTEQTLLVLLHSERVYFDVEFEKENAILLMRWNDKILTDTETRCFVRNHKLIAFSQYYADLDTGYTSVEFNPIKFYDSVCRFVQRLLETKKIPYENAVVDISSSPSEEMLFIEINQFNHDTDSCMFEWEEIDSLESKVPVFKYKRCGHTFTYP